jgi:hypothetical protein
MSATSGFVLGVVAAATLTVLYGEQLSNRLMRVAEQYSDHVEAISMTGSAQSDVSTVPQLTALVAQQPEPLLLELEQVVAAVTVQPEPVPLAEPTLEQRWAQYAAQAGELQVVGEFPWHACFARAAATYGLPQSLLLAVASGESNFDSAARSDKDAVGLMQIRWPDTSRHLGVTREADLYDPCTNVDAGARYLQELSEKFDNNLHLVMAAYNYGPGRIAPGQVPAGANWYSQYIYQHLQQVLGREHIPTSALIREKDAAGQTYQVLMSFNGSYRARDFIAFLGAQVPGLKLEQRSETRGHHDVVLLYRNEQERRLALESIRAAGIEPIQTQSSDQHYL